MTASRLTGARTKQQPSFLRSSKKSPADEKLMRWKTSPSNLRSCSENHIDSRREDRLMIRRGILPDVGHVDEIE